MDSIFIILGKKWPKGFICPNTGTIFYNICIYSRSRVSVYRTIGPLVNYLSAGQTRFSSYCNMAAPGMAKWLKLLFFTTTLNHLIKATVCSVWV